MAVPFASAVCRAARVSHRTQWVSYRQWQSSTRMPHLYRPFSNTPARTARQGDRFGNDADEDEETDIDNVEGDEDGEGTDPGELGSGDADADEVDLEDEQDTGPFSDLTEEEIRAFQNEPGDDSKPHFNQSFFDSLYAEEKDDYLQATPSERRNLESMRAILYSKLGPESPIGRDLEAIAERSAFEVKEEMGPDYSDKGRQPKPAEDFSNMGDPDPEIAPDEEWQDDDISSNAHAELDRHREMREYARLAAWEMPLLANLAVPFRRPSATAQPLRWRYTTYLGTPHPAQHKVVLTFSPSSLRDLTPAQRTKLVKLAGPRFDPHRDEVKMSCESFPSQAQNKRYLGDTFAKLLAEAKDDAGDSFEDVPLDFRHAAKRAPKLQFPREWLLTAERKAELDARRAQVAEEENRRQGEIGGMGGVLDGVRLIEEARLAETNRVAQMAAVDSGVGSSAVGAPRRGRRQ